MAPFPAPETGILLTHFVVSEDVARSRDFYANVLGGEVVSESPAVVALANSWIIINAGGGPTDDKPTVTLTAPDPDTISSFLNIRVADIQEIYEDWSAKGAQFLTPPVDHGVELRCYLRDSASIRSPTGSSTHLRPKRAERRIRRARSPRRS
jgi:catechol 2,3-dioxygenase-like lactoylglutathione lyase family enzyme